MSGAVLLLISFVTLECGSLMVNHFHRLAYRVRPNDHLYKVLKGFARRSEGLASFHFSAYHLSQKSKNPRQLQQPKGIGKAIVWLKPFLDVTP